MRHHALLLIALAGCSPASSNEPDPSDMAEADEINAGPLLADGYEFCDWRESPRSGDLAADIVGTWIVLWQLREEQPHDDRLLLRYPGGESVFILRAATCDDCPAAGNP